MQPEHVATSNAKEGGDCPDCGMAIGMFQRIYKYADEGSTTAQGNGPGVWLCHWCHLRIQNRLEELPDMELWECSACLKMVNPVVILDGKRYCFPCHEAFEVEAGHLPGVRGRGR